MTANGTRKLRLDALVRVSQRDDRQGDEFRSPDQQRAICERWAAANGADIVEVHEAIDVSGKSMDRADVDAAVERLRAGATDGVIVAWLDRFSRAPVGEALRVYDDIQAAGGKVIAGDMAGIDPRDPTGELALTVMLGVNRMQWRRIQERWDMNRADAVKACKAIGGAPFGYRFRDPTPRVRGKGVVDSRLVVDEREAAIVREVFERKVAGATWLELARFMDTVAPKPNGGHWHRNTVRDMISRRTYLGVIGHGEHVKVGAHEAIVSEALWRRAQGAPGRRTPRGTYLLSGLVRCAGCGRRMRGSALGRGGKRVYSCDDASCAARATVTVDRLDDEVLRQFFDHLDEFHVRAVDDSELAAATVAVKERTETVERLAAVVPSHPAAVAAHQAALEDAERTLIGAEDTLHQLVTSATQAGPDVRQLRDDWPTLTLEDRREILRAGIDAILVRRARSRSTPHPPISERLLVLFRGEAPDGLADNGRSGPVRCWTWDREPGSLAAAA
jgi:DNA invertase Pin-like site-specific DNA recombinase